MLSVILTNYNHAQFVAAALDGLFCQTRPADELIVIDDASTDDSISVIGPLLQRFGNARLVCNPVNLGCAANLNRGTAIAQGDILYFAAADDVAYPRLFERGVSLLTTNPQAALISARTDILAENGRALGALATPVPLRHPGYIPPETAARWLMREDGWFTGNTTLYRRALLIDAGGFPEELESFCDGYISRLLALRHGACFSPEILGGWRRLEGGLAWSQTADLVKAAQLVATATRRMAERAEVFPEGYSRRWAHRYLFGAHRFALIQSGRKAKASGIALASWAVVRETVLSLWWFFALRPWDAATVARRRLGLLFRPAAHTE